MGDQDGRGRMNEVEGPKTNDGFGYAFRYRDPVSRMYEVTGDRLEAERVAGDDYEMVLVHFAGNLIDRIVGSAPGEGRVPADDDGGSPSYLDGPVASNTSVDPPGSETPGGELRAGGASRRRRGERGRWPDCPENGVGLAYRYIDQKTGAYGWASDSAQASRIAGDDYEAVWVRYRGGRIDRAVTADEYQEELEVRIGERISEGMSKAQLNEFDLIDDQAEATQWLERNRPDYRDIVEQTLWEMKRGRVLPTEGNGRLEP